MNKLSDVDETIMKYGSYLGLGIIGLLLLSFIFAIVPAGHTGIQDNLGDVNPNSLKPGFHFKAPWTNIVTISNQTQKLDADATAASNDLQDVVAKVTVNYHLNELSTIEVYKKIGRNYADKLIPQAIQESVKAITARYTANQLITERSSVRTGIETVLRDKLLPYGIELESVAITNFEFSESFTQAIEAKVTAEQRALEAQNKLQQVKFEKEQSVTIAEGVAQSTRIKADADAYALSVIREELTKNSQLISYKSVEKWNGLLPYATGSNIPFIQLPGIDQNN